MIINIYGSWVWCLTLLISAPGSQNQVALWWVETNLFWTEISRPARVVSKEKHINDINNDNITAKKFETGGWDNTSGTFLLFQSLFQQVTNSQTSNNMMCYCLPYSPLSLILSYSIMFLIFTQSSWSDQCIS